MGKAAAIPVAIVRGLDPEWFRDGSVRRAHPRPPKDDSSDDSRRRTVPAFLEARRSIRAFTDEPVARDDARRARRGRVHRSRAPPLTSVAVRRRRHRRGQAGPRHRHGRAVAHRPRGPTGWPGPRSTSSSTASHAKLDRRAGAGARLPHMGRPRPLPRSGPAARRVGHGAAVARRRGREPDGRGRRRGTGVVLGRGADLLPRGRARRARAPRGLAPARARARRPPRSRVRRPGSAPRSRSTSSATYPR